MAKKQNPIDTRTRIIIGGIGGIAPLIVSLLVIDLGAVIDDLAMMDAIGLAVRCLVLIFIGALVGYMHNNEREPFKVFQLGIAAPALLTTAINGYGIIGSGAAFKELKTAYDDSGAIPKIIQPFIANAHAAGTSSHRYRNGNAFQQPKVSGIERFLRGLIGRRVSSSGDDWFVIVGSHTSNAKASSQVKRLKGKKYLAKVYQPTDNSHYYAVVIGTNLTLLDAQTLRKKAIGQGLPKDTYLWRK